MTAGFSHIPVLLNECMDGLKINPDGLYVDCTAGGGGHSSEICRRLSARGRLISIDQDADAIAKAARELQAFPNALTVLDNFSNIKNILAGQGISSADGFLLDLGVSSHQLDTGERGFSYNHDARLDMRMDQSSEVTAYDVVNGYSEEKLRRVIADYGEERWAGRIAKFIVRERASAPVATTLGLVEIIKKAIPGSARADGHPAKRSFQAIRIEVNNELGILENAVNDMVSLLNPGGRLCVIAFHSLEDRIIKNSFKGLADPCICPRDLPVCACGRKPQIKVITRKPVLPGAEELAKNRRAHSAKLRVAEKL